MVVCTWADPLPRPRARVTHHTVRLMFLVGRELPVAVQGLPVVQVEHVAWPVLGVNQPLVVVHLAITGTQVSGASNDNEESRQTYVA